MKKKALLFFLIVFFQHFSFGQTGNWLWTKGSSGNGINEGWCVASDTSGNALIGGFMQTAIIVFGTDTLTSNGGNDIVIAKYNSSGNLLWAKNSGGTSGDVCYSIATDNSGNIYATGYFQSSTLVLGTDTLTNNGSQDIILIKYDTSGNVLWAKGAGGGLTDIGYGVACDSLGNVFITGIFGSTSITFGSTTLINGSGGDAIFIVKYDKSGNLLWAQSVSGTYSFNTKGIAIDIFGNAFITGSFNSSSVSFGSFTLNNSNPGADLVFLVKYNPSGNVLWAKCSQNTGSAYGNGVAVDFSGNSYITGSFSYCDSISFGQLTLQNTNQGTADVFVVKYNKAGNVLWANKGSGLGDDAGFGIATDNSDNIYISGGYDRNAHQFSAITFGPYTLPFPSGGKDPMFIVEYDTKGTVLCASSLQSGGDDNSGVATDNFGNAYVGSDFHTSPFIVDNDTLYLNNNGDEQFFLSKFSCATLQNINEINNYSDINIYPNPFSTQTTFQTDKLFKKATLTVYNSFGQTVKQIKNISGNTITLQRDNLPSGIYFYLLTESNNISVTGKLAIMKD